MSGKQDYSSALAKSIADEYGPALTKDEAEAAARNLAGFLSVLIDADRERKAARP